MRDETLPGALSSWRSRVDDRPQVDVALGTFLSHRADVLQRIVDALERVGARAAIAVGSSSLRPVSDDWLIEPRLPQVAMLQHADLVIHHGGNNSVQEALASGSRQIIMPFSTDQFANAADLERVGRATVLSPNEATSDDLASAVMASLDSPSPPQASRPSTDQLVRAVFDPSS